MNVFKFVTRVDDYTNIHIGYDTVVLDTKDAHNIDIQNICVVQNYARLMIKRERPYLHRHILKVDDSRVVDHINHNTLDNRRTNLRLCNQSQNRGNSVKTNKEHKYKGMTYIPTNKYNPWSVYCSIKGKSTYIGCFATQDEAAIAYNIVALKEFGEFACLNNIKED